MRIWAGWGVLTSAAPLLLAACTGPRALPPSTAIDETAFRDHVRVLASDEFEGRRPGTPGEEKTVAYLTEQFRKLGLKPGNGESYLQQVPLVEITAGKDAALSVSGKTAGQRLAYGKDMVIWTKRAAPEALLQHSELVFVGYGITAPEYDWNDYAGIDVRGKTVIVLVNDPGYATRDPKVFKGGAMTYYGTWSYKIAEAARQGASGVLLVHDADAAGIGWNVVVNSWTGPLFELPSADGEAGDPAVEGWVHADAARAMFAQAGRDLAALTAAAARPGFQPVALGLYADAALHNSIRRLSSPNVIALLPGAKSHGEYVVYTAHWDHLGRDPDRAGHNIFNGADDNASGVAGLLVLAQSFVRTKPVADRSIVFLAVTGTESGLLGSEYYVENPIFPLRRTACAINLDTLHIGGPTRDVSVFGFGNTDLEEMVHAAALLQGREMRPEPTPQRGLYFRSDNFSFARHGVPALYVQGGIDDTARGPVWGQAQLDDFTAHRYRQPSDLYTPDWEVHGALDDLELYYEVGNRVARSRRFPRWYPNSEYRVSRAHGAQP